MPELFVVATQSIPPDKIMVASPGDMSNVFIILAVGVGFILLACVGIYLMKMMGWK